MLESALVEDEPVGESRADEVKEVAKDAGANVSMEYSRGSCWDRTE